MGTKKCVERDLGYGDSEYEVSFGLAPRNGELSPSDPETPEPFNSPFRFELPQNLGSWVKTWDSGAYIPGDKRSTVKFTFFLDFRGGEIYFFLTCQIRYSLYTPRPCITAYGSCITGYLRSLLCYEKTPTSIWGSCERKNTFGASKRMFESAKFQKTKIVFGEDTFTGEDNSLPLTYVP